MKGYSVRDVGAMLGISPAQVRTFAQNGIIGPERGPRGEYRFDFQDIVLLRTAIGLTEAKIPPRKVKSALRRLRQQLPSGRPLTAVRIIADGDSIVVRDGDTVWNPDSGQVLFDFAVADLANQIAPLARENAEAARQAEDELDAEAWFDLGFELEIAAPRDARDAYRRAVELDPGHADAHVNLGRILHEDGELYAAEAHYRIALQSLPAHPVAAFNLGVVLEDMGRSKEAVVAYQQAVDIDPRAADAYYNLAGLMEKQGKRAAAFRYLKAYRELVK
ncbi:MAG TPA: tetratricopeptide repeat protein [Thermoanaerobaculia bacterium]|nr:tetratricopeptide repeat protein [Thermoanaerobaculia bacterium]